MPLTPDEVAFLGPTMAEYADIRIGPAWQALHAHGILYPDILWLLEAYQAVDPPRLEHVVTAAGSAKEVLAFGREITPVPECPWADADEARRRNQQLEAEVQALRSAEHGAESK